MRRVTRPVRELAVPLMGSFLLVLCVALLVSGCAQEPSREYGVFLGISGNEIERLDGYDIVVIEPSEFNAEQIEAYLDGAADGSARREEEPATREIQMEEFAFLALRTSQGIEKERFQKKFGATLDAVYAEAIHAMKKKGLLHESKTHVTLTPLGMKYGNLVFAAFLL